jgi:predicted nucleic acid-binding protein
LPGHVFWADDVSIVTSEFVDRRRLVGHRQVTDCHLLALALRRKGKLATFDAGIRDLVPSGTSPEMAVTVIGSS